MVCCFSEFDENGGGGAVIRLIASRFIHTAVIALLLSVYGMSE